MIFGVGGVGTNVVQMCRAFGARQIIAVDRNSKNLEYAKERMGATHTILAGEDVDDIPAQVAVMLLKEEDELHAVSWS